MVHSQEVLRLTNFIETGNRMVVAGAEEGGREELLFRGFTVSNLQDEKFLEADGTTTWTVDGLNTAVPTLRNA